MKKISLIFVILAFTSCSGMKLFKSKPEVDCSAVFENSSNSTAPISPQTQCKVLPIKIHSGVECEISGSDKIDNLIAIYKEDKNDRAILMAPISVLLGDGNSISFKNQLVLYFVKLKIKKYLDSDLFSGLKDFRYQGLSCQFEGNTITGWLGDGQVIASVKENISKKK